MEHRAALVVGSHSEAIELCCALERGETATRLFSGQGREMAAVDFQFRFVRPVAASIERTVRRYPDFRAVNEYDQLSQAEFNRSLFPGLLTQSLLEKPVGTVCGDFGTGSIVAELGNRSRCCCRS